MIIFPQKELECIFGPISLIDKKKICVLWRLSTLWIKRLGSSHEHTVFCRDRSLHDWEDSVDILSWRASVHASDISIAPIEPCKIRNLVKLVMDIKSVGDGFSKEWIEQAKKGPSSSVSWYIWPGTQIMLLSALHCWIHYRIIENRIQSYKPLTVKEGLHRIKMMHAPFVKMLVCWCPSLIVWGMSLLQLRTCCSRSFPSVPILICITYERRQRRTKKTGRALCLWFYYCSSPFRLSRSHTLTFIDWRREYNYEDRLHSS